jgi:hypothetical protein
MPTRVQPADRLKLHSEKTSSLMGKRAQYNPRRISQADLEALGRSMKEFGVVEPVVVNKRFDRVVGGHQRIEAANAVGITALPVVYVDLDAKQEKVLNLALNRIRGDFDAIKLAEMLAELPADMINLAGFGDDEAAEVLRAAAGLSDGTSGEVSSDMETVDATAPSMAYQLVFDSAEDLDKFYAVVRSLRRMYPSEETVAARMLAFWGAHGLPDGEGAD